MTSENAVFLLDTNVWVDNYLGYRPHSSAANALITSVLDQNATLAYAATSLKDVFYLIASESKRMTRQTSGTLTEEQARACLSFAWGCIDNMTEIAIAVPVAEPQIFLARHYRGLHTDFEDDLVLAAVETSAADYFVTNDSHLLGKCSSPAFTCVDMLAYLER